MKLKYLGRYLMNQQGLRDTRTFESFAQTCSRHRSYYCLDKPPIPLSAMRVKLEVYGGFCHNGYTSSQMTA